MKRGGVVSSEKWISAFCLVGFLGAGITAWSTGQLQSGCFFFGLVAVSILGFAYQAYRRRTSPEGGPPDPSAHWRAFANATQDDQVTNFRYSKGSIVAIRYFAALPTVSGAGI